VGFLYLKNHKAPYLIYIGFGMKNSDLRLKRRDFLMLSCKNQYVAQGKPKIHKIHFGASNVLITLLILAVSCNVNPVI
jgi:hypothetical protein